MKVYAKCQCGETKCPQKGRTVAQLRDDVRAWLVKLGFARLEHGTLFCPICKGAMDVRVDATNE